jgi:uncharacterized membrane protein YfcA
MPAPQAVGTALMYVAIVKLIAAPMFVVRKQVNYRVLALLVAGGLPGALIGSFALTGLQTKGMNGVMLFILGLTIVLSASINFIRRQAGTIHGADKATRLPWFSFPIGMEVGFSSAGAGALGSLLLMHWTTLTAGEIVGTDVLFGLALSLGAGGIHLTHGNVDGAVLQQLLYGGIPGAVLGAYLATVVPNRGLRKALAVWLIYLGLNLCWKGLGSLV